MSWKFQGDGRHFGVPESLHWHICTLPGHHILRPGETAIKPPHAHRRPASYEALWNLPEFACSFSFTFLLWLVSFVLLKWWTFLGEDVFSHCPPIVRCGAFGVLFPWLWIIRDVAHRDTWFVINENDWICHGSAWFVLICHQGVGSVCAFISQICWIFFLQMGWNGSWNDFWTRTSLRYYHKSRKPLVKWSV